MSSPSSVISTGLGSWGSVPLVLTLGYGSFGGAAATGFGRLEYTMPRSQLECTLADEQLEFALKCERLEFTGVEP